MVLAELIRMGSNSPLLLHVVKVLCKPWKRSLGNAKHSHVGRWAWDVLLLTH